MKSKIPTLLGLLVLVVGLAFGVALLKYRQVFRLKADSTLSPKDLRISNLTDKSVTISWTTAKEAAQFVKWGDNQSSLDNTANDLVRGVSKTHYVNITGLNPQTTYYFKISSSETNFDNNGIPWQTKTGRTLSVTPKSLVIAGVVKNESGSPIKDAVVYVPLEGNFLSALTKDNGGWLISLAKFRTSDLSKFVSINEASTLLEINAQSAPGQTGSIQIYPQSAKPAPDIVIGKVTDYRNLPKSEGVIPDAEIGLPEGEEESSLADASTQSPSPTPTEIKASLTSVSKDQVLKNSKPTFSGKGTPGTKITITIESDPITAGVVVDSEGNWSYTPTTPLSNSSHKITISWKNAVGKIQSSVTNFVVSASAATSSPTISPSPFPTPSPLSSPTPKPTTTVSPTPEILTTSGSLTPTSVVFIMGIIFLGLSLLLWGYSSS